nr:hypothetical protein Iba_chr03aCG2940 [Ipomoea batatas]
MHSLYPFNLNSDNLRLTRFSKTFTKPLSRVSNSNSFSPSRVTNSPVFCSACICGICPFGDSELTKAVVSDAVSEASASASASACLCVFKHLGAIGVDENQGKNCDCGDVSDDNCDNQAGFETEVFQWDAAQFRVPGEGFHVLVQENTGVWNLAA